ncbi:hypothetical protein HBH98_251950 [Parastagonospora nodorum]|nr:hypothetical protein HBH51_245250 [Parastagonospora nodorum]KAH4223059.1 hypothetical protein HBI05_251280 [Parastagonospora nodorum]KAH4332791.1 hypothetical protein HBH98_251950 [Parastagonospora nodorum]KAH4376417.1 hypothetical protein HBH99_210910 [Parastagonospora nodorum]KAH4893384.1 hypothetical protein HBI80_247980 [Parastagonospora nodorum]
MEDLRPIAMSSLSTKWISSLLACTISGRTNVYILILVADRPSKKKKKKKKKKKILATGLRISGQAFANALPKFSTGFHLKTDGQTENANASPEYT